MDSPRSVNHNKNEEQNHKHNFELSERNLEKSRIQNIHKSIEVKSGGPQKFQFPPGGGIGGFPGITAPNWIARGGKAQQIIKRSF